MLECSYFPSHPLYKTPAPENRSQVGTSGAHVPRGSGRSSCAGAGRASWRVSFILPSLHLGFLGGLCCELTPPTGRIWLWSSESLSRKRLYLWKCSHGPLYVSCPFLEHGRDPRSSVLTFPLLDTFSHSPLPPCPARMPVWPCLPAPPPPAHHPWVTPRLFLCWSV